MSLIDQALKRAQAAQQDAGAPRASRPWVPAPLPDRRRTGIWRLRGALLGTLLLGVLGAGVLRLAGRAPGKSAGGEARVPATAGPSEDGTRGSGPPSAKPEDSPAALGSEILVPPPARVPVNLGNEETRRPFETETKGQSAGPALEAPGAPGPSGPPHPARDRKTASGEERTFVAEFRPSSGSKIELGGIAYSETHPVALINGRVVETGATIEGFTLAEIQPDRVKLEREDEKVWIRLK